MIFRRSCLGFCILVLAACGDWKTDPSALTARTSAPTVGPSCSSCHGYPLNDTNHVYHLFIATGNRSLNGTITCMDCHSTAIRFHEITLLDSVFEQPDGEQWLTQENPNPGDTTSDGVVIRSLPLLRVDTLRQHRPFPMPDRPGAAPKFQEYMTGLAHMNDKVDVVFDSRISNPVRFLGQSAAYNPTNETCSAVACHPGDRPYSWGSVAKGLPVLTGQDTGNAAP